MGLAEIDREWIRLAGKKVDSDVITKQRILAADCVIASLGKEWPAGCDNIDKRRVIYIAFRSDRELLNEATGL
jgi:hypothetical protein